MLGCAVIREKTETDRLKNEDIVNQKNDSIPITSPIHYPHNEYVGWLSRWRIGNKLEAGDESTVTFDIKDEYEVKECGFKIVYYDPEEANGSASAIDESHHYFAHVSRCFEKNPDEDLWLPTRGAGRGRFGLGLGVLVFCYLDVSEEGAHSLLKCLIQQCRFSAKY